ncbi:MAG: isoprenyl transferase [Chloroflexota bacterium]
MSEATAQNLPRHVAIIMDGNGRWARRRGLPRALGHRAGVKALHDVVRAAVDLGIEVLTLYAFSTENWRRPKAEVDELMRLLVEFVDRDLPTLTREGAHIRIVGDRNQLTPEVLAAIDRAEQATVANERMDLVIALNYGGRQEIVDAARRLAARAVAGSIKPEAIDEDTLAGELLTAGLPDVDLLIRPGAEKRLSNFLLWQCAYAELYFLDVLWPDFGASDLREAIKYYQSRERRFGGLGDGSS